MDFRNYVPACLLSPEDERDYHIGMLSSTSTDPLPLNYEVAYQFDAKNQGQINSCVGHSVSEWFEIVFKSVKPFSPGFVYGNRDASEYQGQGWYNKSAFAHAIRDGVCLLEDMPFNMEVPVVIKTVTDNKNLYTKAAANKALSYVKLNNAEEIKRFIYDHKAPVVISIAIYESFYNTGKDGKVPTKSGKLIGYHSVLVTGWREDGTLIVLNSWSKEWGSNGYCYITEDIITEAWGATAAQIIQPTPTTSKIYKVRLGGYSREVAQDYVNKLNAAGIGSALIADGDKFAVQCGAYKSKDNALAMKQKIADTLISITEVDA